MFSSKSIVSKMNKIRLMYIESNNKINEHFDQITSIFSAENKNLQPVVSAGIRLVIQEKLKAMREMAVNGINNTFEKGLHYMPHNDLNFAHFPTSRRFPRHIIDYLEESFKRNNYPIDFEKARLAKCCSLSIKQVNNWFTNKRNRNKIYISSNKS